jgi:hypothetical protein
MSSPVDTPLIRGTVLSSPVASVRLSKRSIERLHRRFRPYCTKLQSEQLGLVLADVAEWTGVETRLFRQAEDALTYDVALDLIGAARD